MRVRLTPPAEADLEEALTWYGGIREGLAAHFLDEFERLLERLRDNPHQFPPVRRDIRRAGFRRFPYGLVFRVLAGEVEIVACFHDRRDPRHWSRRM
ncbi:type II toxin-antitoxin system RelE/ParE family toxin [Niveispirillum sp. SYP-B3756]|uniref:type II toxin-antitoxin system RelE/ParE family toxin n=1 Tax=Niveispirillum sp. SYP-B3756 TaxID=2662178 RepID=UPI0012922EE7|nr:type II toxin-antitoxin system RelE/ParE family toxin [Niveispirillum sp. SYP-B3756]MQP68669.1 type II toxin-antitoxin system RelE/ParE family toxin [Niveispirillum sp. SYP-B3756]